MKEIYSFFFYFASFLDIYSELYLAYVIYKYLSGCDTDVSFFWFNKKKIHIKNPIK